MGLFDIYKNKTIRIKSSQFDQNEKQYLYFLALTKAVYEIGNSVKEGSGNDLEIIKPEFDRINKFLDSTFSDNEIEKLKNEIGERFEDDSWQELLGDFLSNLNDNQKDKFIRSLMIFANSDGILELDEMNIIGEWTRGCFPNKNENDIKEYLIDISTDLSVNMKKLNFDFNEFNELQRKSILGLLIGVAGIDGFDDENKETDLLSEVSEHFKITKSDMDTLPDFEEAVNNLKGLSIKQKSIFKNLVDLMVKADGELSKPEIELVNYFNQNIILESDSDKDDNKITNMETYENWVTSELTEKETHGNLYKFLGVLKESEVFENEISNMETIFDELKEGNLLNEDQVKQRIIDLYSSELNENSKNIETSSKLKEFSDKYLQIENILGVLLNTMEEEGDTKSDIFIDTQQYHSITTFFYKILKEKSTEFIISSFENEGVIDDKTDYKGQTKLNEEESSNGICFECFTRNDDDSNFCSECGTKL